MDNEKARVFQMRVSDDWLKSIDDWRRAQSDIPSRSAAIRRLTSAGLDVIPIVNEMLAFFEKHGDHADAETQAQIMRLRGIVSG